MDNLIYAIGFALIVFGIVKPNIPEHMNPSNYFNDFWKEFIGKRLKK